MTKGKSISDGIRIVTNDIADRHASQTSSNFTVAENWPMMMAMPELNNIYEHSEEIIRSVDRTVRVEIDRPAFNRISFDDLHQRIPRQSTPIKEKLLKKFTFSKSCLTSSVLTFFPFVQVFKGYKFKEFILKDLIAGLSVGLIDIPQSMGFGLLSGVSPIYGLYSSFFPVLMYFFLGQSRHITVGTMAIISIMIRNVVDREADYYQSTRRGTLEERSMAEGQLNQTITSGTANITTDFYDEDLEAYKAAVASAVSLLSCIIMLFMGFLKLGVVKKLMPTSFISGFTTGAAFHIATSQMPAILGIKIAKRVGAFKLPYLWIDILTHIPKATAATVTLSIIVLTILIVFKEYINVRFSKQLPFPIPIEAMVLIVTTGISYGVNFNSHWGVQIVGTIHKGILPPTIPPLDRATSFLTEAFIIAILSFVITISMTDIFARKYNYPIDTNHELISNAISYGIGAIFHSFMGAAAPPRCFIQETCGAKTKVAALFTALLLLFVILLLGPLFESLPKSVLGCIIFVAIFPLFKQFKMLQKLWKVSRVDFCIWLVTWSTVVFLDVPIGLGIGVLAAILAMPLIAMAEEGYLLGRTPFQDIYAPLKTYRLVCLTGDILIFRFENALFFATVEKFKQRLFDLSFNPSKRRRQRLEKKRKPQQPLREIGVKTITQGSTEKKDAPRTSGDNLKPLANGGGIGGRKKAIIPQNVDLTKMNEQRAILAIILDCSAMTYVDLMGLITLKELSIDYKAVGTRFILAGCTESLLQKLEDDEQIRSSTGDKIFVFPTIQDAILQVNMIRLSRREKNRKISVY